MEGSLPTGSMVHGESYEMIDPQNPIRIHHSQHQSPSFLHHHHQNPNNPQHQSSMIHPQMLDVFPQSAALPALDYTKGERGKTSSSEDDEPSFTTEDGVKGKKGWQRVKWTDGMVRLLITTVSYLDEDVAPDCHNGGRRKFAILQKKGKWKPISEVLAERGCCVSPQQCEDKFNDLNKRYKRLTDILGRGTSCKVVENPALLGVMDHLSEKAKEDARRILSSKHLFYEEMCSYHNANRLNLPADPALQRSLQSALRSGDGHDAKRGGHDDHGEGGVDSDDGEDHVGGSCFSTRLKKGTTNSHPSHDCDARPQNHGITVDMEQVIHDQSRADLAQKQHMASRKLQLEEQSLHVQAEMLELEKQRFKWMRFSKKKESELEKMRMENERLKLENKRMELELELELKRREPELNRN